MIYVHTIIINTFLFLTVETLADEGGDGDGELDQGDGPAVPQGQDEPGLRVSEQTTDRNVL